jgi:hypothetical protein
MSDKKDNEDLAKAIVKDKNKDFDKGLAKIDDLAILDEIKGDLKKHNILK